MLNLGDRAGCAALPDGGSDVVRADGEAGSRPLHVPGAGAGDCLLLRVFAECVAHPHHLALAGRFDEHRYHDFIVAQGPLPFELLEQAAEEEFLKGTQATGQSLK